MIISLTKPRTETPKGDGTLMEFLRLSPSAQLRVIKGVKIENLKTLRDQIEAYAEVHGGSPVTLEVLIAIMWLCEPKLYSDREQSAALRQKTTPAALKKVRMATYESKIRPLLHFSVAKQKEYVISLSIDDRAALLKLLDHYAREFGRSERCRSFEELIRSI